MDTFAATDAGYDVRVRDGFSRLTLMRTIGARLVEVAPGKVDLDLTWKRPASRRSKPSVSPWGRCVGGA